MNAHVPNPGAKAQAAGWFKVSANGLVAGWIRWPTGGDTGLELIVDGTPRARFEAIYPADTIANLVSPEQKRVFFIILPPDIRDGQKHEISIRSKSTGDMLVSKTAKSVIDFASTDPTIEILEVRPNTVIGILRGLRGASKETLDLWRGENRESSIKTLWIGLEDGDFFFEAETPSKVYLSEGFRVAPKGVSAAELHAYPLLPSLRSMLSTRDDRLLLSFPAEVRIPEGATVLLSKRDHSRVIELGATEPAAHHRLGAELQGPERLALRWPGGSVETTLDGAKAKAQRHLEIMVGPPKPAQVQLVSQSIYMKDGALSGSVIVTTHVDISGALAEVATNGLVLSQFELRRITSHRFKGSFSVACTRQTASSPLTLAINTDDAFADFSLTVGPPPAPPTNLPAIIPMADVVEGHVDGLRRTKSGSEGIGGWVRDPSRPGEGVLVDVFAGGSLIGTCLAETIRSDVGKHRGGSPVCGFFFELPDNLGHGVDLDFEVRARARSGTLSGARFTARRGPKGQLVAPSRAPQSISWTGKRMKGARTVDAVILNKDGSGLLNALLESSVKFERKSFSRIIIIDHGSVDDSRSVAESFSNALPIIWQARTGDYSFSESNNFGAALGDADIVAFINNDIVFTRPIIANLASHATGDVGAVGVRLMDPPADGPIPAQALQHVGVHLCARGQRGVIPFESRVLTDIPAANRQVIETPIVTAALMLVPRTTFDQVGGFDERYFYGWEDSDLCLKIGAADKRIISVNTDEAIHIRGFSRRLMSPATIARRLDNPRIFSEKWSYALSKSLREAYFGRFSLLSGRSLNVGLIVTETGDEAQAGDYMTAVELANALSANHDIRTYLLPVAEEVDAQDLDVVISLLDTFDVRRVKNLGAASLLVAWPRNWFHRWAARPWRERFNFWFASSQVAADYLSKELCRTVRVLPIAGNPQAMQAGKSRAELQADVVLTAHNWGGREKALALRPDDDLSVKIVGRGWEDTPLAAWSAGPVSYAEIPDVYASAKIVVDHSNLATKSWGAANSRIFDALAAGRLVLTNNRLASQELFDGLLPVYESPDSLRTLITRYLADDNARRSTVEKLRKIVLDRHTYQHRADSLVDMLRGAISDGLSIAIKIAAPSLAASEGWGDLYFARSLRKELEKLGHSVRIDCLDDWYGNHTETDDAVIVLKGLDSYKADTRKINILWIISHPDLVTGKEVLQYDSVFSASPAHAKLVSALTGVEIGHLPQATDTETFWVGEGGRDLPFLFVGNSRNVRRKAVEYAVDLDLDLAVYGGGWAKLPQRMLKGNVVENHTVGDFYRRARVVLNDHWSDMQRLGFVSNRIFDAVAAGAIVLSDEIEGLQALFGEAVLTFNGTDDFKAKVEAIVCDPEPYQAASRKAADEIRLKHSFVARAKFFDGLLRSIDKSKRVWSLRSSVPSAG